MSFKFRLIDISTWNREEYFDHYLNKVPCTYSMTLNLRVTVLLKESKKQGFKLYPTMIYLLSTIVNRYEEFRTAIDENGKPGIFDILYPSYTIFQKDSETFTNIWTEYTPQFLDFHERYLLDVQTYGGNKCFVAKQNVPPNIFYISSIPWINFTGLNLNLPKGSNYLLPIFTIGKYFEQNGHMWLPIAMQLHHAVCDGFHAGRFVQELQQAMDTLLSNYK